MLWHWSMGESNGTIMNFIELFCWRLQSTRKSEVFLTNEIISFSDFIILLFIIVLLFNNFGYIIRYFSILKITNFCFIFYVLYFMSPIKLIFIVIWRDNWQYYYSYPTTNILHLLTKMVAWNWSYYRSQKWQSYIREWIAWSIMLYYSNSSSQAALFYFHHYYRKTVDIWFSKLDCLTKGSEETKSEKELETLDFSLYGNEVF